MVAAKTEAFPEQQRKLADFAKALSHPARIGIVLHLQANPGSTCGQLVTALPLAQATVSQHLKALMEADLLKGQPAGTSMRYFLKPDNILNFCRSFQAAIGGPFARDLALAQSKEEIQPAWEAADDLPTALL